MYRSPSAVLPYTGTRSIRIARPPVNLQWRAVHHHSVNMSTGIEDLDTIPPRARDVLQYWFGEGYGRGDMAFYPQANVQMWFNGGPRVDKEVTEQFGGDLERIAAGEYDSWMHGGPLTLLAGVVLMDQFSRHVYRGTPRAFALDAKALAWAQHAVAIGQEAAVPGIMRYFLHLPFTHAEDLAVQEKGVELANAAAKELEAAGPAAAATAQYLATAVGFAVRHRDVVAAWGRFPHRNAILGRESTPEEVAGLADGSIHKF